MTAIELTPSQAVEDFLEEKRGDVAKSSWRNYRYPLREFIAFCADREIENVSDLTGYDLKRFKIRRRDDPNVGKVTLRNNLSVIRVFLRWCEEAQLVERGFHDLVKLPRLEDGELVSNDVLELDEIEEILDYLYKFEYAHRRHATFQLMWHTCIRMGSLISLDLDDYQPNRQRIRLRHRPDTGTPLKNGSDGERLINLSDQMCEVLDDYIAVHRNDVTDEHGREPLFTSPSKRLYDTLLRKDMYAITRPCHIGLDCPHDRDPETCDAAHKRHASKCPSSMSPHPLRRAAITYHLNQEWPKEKLSERANVTVSVLDTHYDARSEDEAAATRKQYLENL